MTYGSLFAGVGGIDLAFVRAGFTVSWQVEIDRQCRGVLARHFPQVLRLDDVRKCGRRNLKRVDVIAGGFPCQNLSVAGQRAGLNGAESGLFWEMLRIVDELRPRFLVWENVPGLLSSFTPTEPPPDAVEGREWEVEEDSDFETLLAALAERGFHGAWRVLDAQFFGVPQRRDRVFGVFARGRAGAERCAEILSLAGGVPGDPSALGEAEQDLAGSLGAGTSGRGWSDDTDRMTFVPSCASTDRARTGGNGSPERSDATLVATAYRTSGNCGVMEQGDRTAALNCATDPTQQFIAFQQHGSDLGKMGALRRGKGDVQSGVPFIAGTLGNNGKAAASATRQDAKAGLLVACTLPASDGGVSNGHHPVVAYTLHGSDGCSSTASEADVAQSLRCRAPGQIENCSTTVALAPLAFDTTQITNPENRNQPRPGDPCHTLAAGAHAPAIAFQERRRDGEPNIEWQEDLAYSLRVIDGGGCGDWFRVQSGKAVRRLTPLECERLQGLPDDWTRWDADGNELKDGPRYRMIGNGVAVPCVEWFARRMAAVLSTP